MSVALHMGTCSWNYDSWVGLVYGEPKARSADYLVEYAKKYRSVEIDSWFYRIPAARDVEEYAAAVDRDFRFICKAPMDLTLTHRRGKAGEPNPAFLSPELYSHFLERTTALHGQISAIILEFEYLNRQKMPDAVMFREKLERFAASVPRDIPLAIEARNAAYIDAEWFGFISRNALIHVFSEKRYMPPVVDLYRRWGGLLGDTVILRLMGGDREAIEAATGGRWDHIVDPKPGLPAIGGMIAELLASGRDVHVDVNNHFEGSAPLTMERLLEYL